MHERSPTQRLMLSQSVIGTALCSCIPTAHAIEHNASMAPCPMGMKTCCACCKSGKEHSSQVTLKSASACLFQVSGVTDLLVNASWLTTFTPAFLQPELVVPVTARASDRLPISVHLSIPRIRPPDPNSHGLRAPPTR